MSQFLGDLAKALAQAAKKPNILNYVPNSPIHEAFHKSDKLGRLLVGGNRSGKSVAGCVEAIRRATGRHPYYKTHGIPTDGRIVTVDRDNGIEHIIKPLLKQWTPPSELVNGSWEDSFSGVKKMMTFANGSTIDIKTHQQDIDAFAGVPRHWIWFDEECPQAVFNECRLRLVDYNGVWWMTMTPVIGHYWIFDRFISTKNVNVEMFEVNISDNPHLNKEALEALQDDLSDDEKSIRQDGTFIPHGGIILREFNPEKHVVHNQDIVPRGWDVYVSIDHGYNNPTAILWNAVSPEGNVVTLREHYKRRMLVEEHAAAIKRINAELGVSPKLYVGDPSMSMKSGITGTSPMSEYRDKGIPLVPATRDVAGRINKMNEYLKGGKWVISSRCVNLIREMRTYSFKTYASPKIADRSNLLDIPMKKNDHAVDAEGYFFNFMPRISVPKTEKPFVLSQTEVNREDFPWEVDFSFYGSRENPEYAFGEV